jgi:putative two-component system response regulator
MADSVTTILLVDDDPINIKLLAHALQDHYEIIFAMSGEEALALATASRPDLILLDVVMPGWDGYMTCAKLKAQGETADIPVIFVTALGDSEAERRGIELGGVGYITKPIDPAIVASKVRSQILLRKS